MSDSNNTFSDDLFKVRHDLECLSNDIKFLIPSLITRIEYNKFVNRSDNPALKSELELKKTLSDTISFLEHLKQFSDVH